MIILEYILSELAHALPFPKKDADKYSRGKLTIIGGGADYPGAAGLAAMAAQNMGAGYVEVLCAPESMCVIRSYRSSLVVSSWKDERRIESLLCKSDSKTAHPEAVLIGSGFTAHDAYSSSLVLNVLERCECPVIVDGGAISSAATAQGAALCKMRAESGRITVFTPHMGEAARLAVQARISAPTHNAAEGSLARFAYSLAEGMSSTIMLKGPTTFISTCGKDEVYAMRQGTPALAKAGSGDVLAGMVSALFAQHTVFLKKDPVKACALASTLHAIAGREAAEKNTDICVSPEDLIENIHNAVRFMLEFV